MTKLSDLPDGTYVAVDTETSGLFVDDGARLSIVSYAFRDPESGELFSKTLAWDQGWVGLPLGDKDIPKTHLRRMSKAEGVLEHDFQEVAPNLNPAFWVPFVEQLKRFRLIMANCKFDLHMLRMGLRGREWFTDPWGLDTGWDLSDNIEWDVVLAQTRIDPSQSSALKPTASRYGLSRRKPGEEARALDPYKGPKADPRYDLIPWSAVEGYADEDARETYLLWEYQKAMLSDPDHPLHVDDPAVVGRCGTELRQAITLYRMERKGVGFARDECMVERDKLSVLLADAKKPMMDDGWPRVTAHIARAQFFGECTRPPVKEHTGFKEVWVDSGDWTIRKPDVDKLTDGGQPQVDEEAVARLIADGVKWAPEYAHHENLKSALTKWYDKWPELVGHDGRLRTNHKQTSVSTGRLAVERWQSQNMPHDGQLPPGIVPIRHLILPSPQRRLWEPDISQADIRAGAAIAECKALLEGFEAGLDAHTAAAWQMFEDLFRRERCPTIEDASNSPQWSQRRFVAKQINLSTQYGGGPKKLQEIMAKAGHVYTVKEVTGWRDQWRATYPEMVTAMKIAEEQALNQGFVYLYNGHRRYFSDFELMHAYKAFNAKVQGAVAEIMKLVMPAFEAKYPGTLLLQVHDSLILDVLIRQEQEVLNYATHLMTETYERELTHRWTNGRFVTVPFKADVKRFNMREWKVEGVLYGDSDE